MTTETVEKQDLEVWLEGDAAESEPCFVGSTAPPDSRHQPAPQCPNEAVMTVTWSCGDDTSYCLPHLEAIRESFQLYDIMQCAICGGEPVTVAGVRPVRRG